VKRSKKKRLFRFASKRNKAKTRSINFALVGSEKFEGKRSEKKIFRVSVRNACETDLVLLRFVLKRKHFLAKPAHPNGHAARTSCKVMQHEHAAGTNAA
jgi:hypothetical protein